MRAALGAPSACGDASASTWAAPVNVSFTAHLRFLHGGDDPGNVIRGHVVVDWQRHDSRANVRRDG